MTTTDTISALMNPFAVTGEIGGHTVVMETGRLAQQAHGAVTITCGETILLATAVMSEQSREGIDFLPLTVEFEERLYAVGKIPGSFFRREGRPGTEAILSARLTDRSIRPLFPKGLHNEIQVIITVLSVDEAHPPETLGMVAASAALSISRIPFEGPIAACRVTWNGSEYLINPSYQQISASRLDMVVASNRGAIMMVESGSVDVSEEAILEGIRLAHESNVQTIELIDQLVAERGAEKLTVTYDAESTAARQQKVDALVNGRIAEVLERNAYKSERDSSLDAIEKEVAAQLADDLVCRRGGRIVQEPGEVGGPQPDSEQKRQTRRAQARRDTPHHLQRGRVAPGAWQRVVHPWPNAGAVDCHAGIAVDAADA